MRGFRAEVEARGHKLEIRGFNTPEGVEGFSRTQQSGGCWLLPNYDVSIPRRVLRGFREFLDYLLHQLQRPRQAFQYPGGC